MTVPWHPPGWMLTGSSHFPPEGQVRVVSGSLQGPLGAGRHGGRDQLEADVRAEVIVLEHAGRQGLGPLQQANEPRSATNHGKGPSHSLFLQRPLPATCYPALERPLLVGSYPPPKKTPLQEILNTMYFLQKVNNPGNGILLSVLTYLAEPHIPKALPAPDGSSPSSS